jgi:DNA-binding transcriptional MerR regulator
MRGMDDDTRYSIGDLARRTRLSVRTIRFYSDCGVLPPADRSPSGYRRYGLEALAHLDLIRTWRELDVDLVTIGRVLDHEVSIAEVAGVHAEALDVQIRTLRLRRAVLRAVAKRGSSPEEMRRRCCVAPTQGGLKPWSPLALDHQGQFVDRHGHSPVRWLLDRQLVMATSIVPHECMPSDTALALRSCLSPRIGPSRAFSLP